jgi:hypothetical protein
MALINQPPSSPVDTQDVKGILMMPREGWRNWFQQVFLICNALTMSGSSAQRPTAMLWPGRVYFDRTLNQPVWYDGTDWVDSQGISV